MGGNILNFNKGALILLAIFFVPMVAFSAGLVPCGGADEASCTFNDFIAMIQNVINFLMFSVAMPLAAVLFAWAGILMLISGGSQEKIKQAKGIFGWVFIGILIALAAWLIIKLITSTLLSSGYSYL